MADKKSNEPRRENGRIPTYQTAYHGAKKKDPLTNLARIIVEKFDKRRVPENTIDTIPFDQIYPDGLCRIGDNFYSKMVQFYDINYQLAQNDEKQHIFAEYCQFLNYFDETIHFQFCFINQRVDMEEYKKVISIPDQDDEFNVVRREYATYLRNQLEKGNNGIVKSKYLVFGIEARDRKQAVSRLAKIESDVINKFKLLGCKCVPVNGLERLRIMHERYVRNKDGILRLTASARKQLDRCVINIQERKYIAYANVNKDIRNCAYMYKVEGIDERLLIFHPEYQAPKNLDPDEAYDAFKDHLFNGDRQEEEMELIRMLGDPTTTLCQCLWFLMEKRKWLYPETFNEKTLLHKNYHGKIKNNKYNNMKTNVLMPICVGLKLVLRLTEKVFDKSDNKLNYYNDPDKSYIRIMEFMPGLSIQDFNTILEKQGLAPLGTVSKDEK